MQLNIIDGLINISKKQNFQWKATMNRSDLYASVCIGRLSAGGAIYLLLLNTFKNKFAFKMLLTVTAIPL